MTSINYRQMMKEAREKAIAKASTSAPAAEPQEADVMAALSGNAVDDSSYIVERYEYDMDQEIARFHDIFSKWCVGSFEHVYYIPNFITEEEERILLSNIAGQPQECWTQLKRRRLQNWGGTPSSEGMVEECLPEWLDSICDRLYAEQFLPARPNHALINEYKGDEGISAHKDGPVYFPRVVILSIGGSTQMTFRDRLREPTQQSALLLKPRSLLVFTKDAYEKLFHEIPVQLVDKVSSEFVNCSPEEIGHSFTRTSRVSITLRVVPVTKRLQETS